MGTAFSSIPDDNESTRSPYFFRSASDRSTVSEKDSSYVVDWEKPRDVEDPMHWTMRSRWVQILLVSISTLQAAVVSSAPAPAVPSILKEFNAPEGVLTSLVVSIFNLGFVFGPVLAAPMSELYGRYPAYTISNLIFLACNAACAVSHSLGVLLFFRFLSGCAGAAPLSIGGGTIADVAPPALRGRAVAVYSIAPLLGPVLGPAAGGFLAEYLGWRWIFWTLCIMAGALGVVMILLLRETSAKTLLEKRSRKIRKITGDSRYVSALDDGISPGEAFSRAIKRPLRLLILHPVVLALSFYFAVVYGYMYLFFTTFAMVFMGQYGFSASFSGLTFMGVGIGTVFGTTLVSIWSDRIAATLLLKEGVRRPEFRLPLMAYSVPMIPVGLVLYGWSAEKSIFWLVPMIGTTIVGVGIMFVFTPLASYLVDAFSTHAASALAASTIFRSVFGALLPLAGPSMYSALGLGWGNTVLAAFSVIMAPIPWVILKRGPHIRERYAHRMY
ncbi:polyamine transporter 1 [Colletotrichum phormii]|uniref:Polyamine transporter 1 n=1 Tax=Colletotrichum phormii TaxID=359342 RepID=A0AAI9ZPU6_9PEZI|nr:polyamine transporter 1 [Colletotrichum phormii]KAK1635601.1 polyamine transporter 1 [Colletotrichum phormii]